MSDKLPEFCIRFEPSDVRSHLQTDSRRVHASRSYFTLAGRLRITIRTNPVAFDLCIQGSVLDAEEACRARLIATSPFQSNANEIGLKALHFVLEPQAVIA